MGFARKAVGFNPLNPLEQAAALDPTGLTGSITGQDAAEAASKAAEAQVRAEERSIQRQEPFAQFGRQFLGQAGDILRDPNAFLQNNPMFDAALRASQTNIFNQAAAGSGINRGGVQKALFDNFLAQGQNFTNNRINQLLSPIRIGQATVTDQAVGDTNIGAAQAGGIVGASNARAAGAENLLGLGTKIFTMGA